MNQLLPKSWPIQKIERNLKWAKKTIFPRQGERNNKNTTKITDDDVYRNANFIVTPLPYTKHLPKMLTNCVSSISVVFFLAMKQIRKTRITHKQWSCTDKTEYFHSFSYNGKQLLNRKIMKYGQNVFDDQISYTKRLKHTDKLTVAH